MKNLEELTEFYKSGFFNIPRTAPLINKEVLGVELDKVLAYDNKITQSLKLLNKLMGKLSENDFNMLPHYGAKYVFPEHILIVGCGGIGSWFVPKFVKLLNDAKRKGMLGPNFKSVTLCDGDHVEESNLIRQNFCSRDIDKNKAEVLFKRYSGELDGSIQFGYIDKFILAANNIATKKPEFRTKFASFDAYFSNVGINTSGSHNVLIINLIDNNETRKDIHNLRTTYRNSRVKIAIVDVANSVYNGQLNFSTTEKYITSALANFVGNPGLDYWTIIQENAFLNDKISIFDCSRADVQAVEQLFDINNMAATVLCSFLNTWLETKKIHYIQLSFSTGNNISIKPEHKLFNIGFPALVRQANAVDLERMRNEPLNLCSMESTGSIELLNAQLFSFTNNGRGKGGNHKSLMRGLYNIFLNRLSYTTPIVNALRTSVVDWTQPNILAGKLMTPEENEKFHKDMYMAQFRAKQEADASNDAILTELI